MRIRPVSRFSGKTGCAGVPRDFERQKCNAVYAYTDLLLHDLGPGLDDGIAEGAARSSEWRTAPLWDVAGSLARGGLLHDGRARNIEEAVAWHGGEASQARQAFNALSSNDRKLLNDFYLDTEICGYSFCFAHSLSCQWRPWPILQKSRAILPRSLLYRAFRPSRPRPHVQQQAWTDFLCETQKGAALQSLTAAFSDLSDAWADVEFMRIGPGATSLRIDRFNWWLDRTDSTGKALTAMLAAKPEDLTVEKLASGSVAGQGLPIIERLLFPKSEAAKLQTKAGAQRCAVGLAAAREQASIADQIVGDWNAPDGRASRFDGRQAMEVFVCQRR
ncbi:MAG: di-heme oxidoredictase family protein [Rhizomicrobium sp.]